MALSRFETGHLAIEGQPALLQAGAFHYFRLPHHALWRPSLDALRAAGFNAVTLPIPWAYHCPEPGFYDFTGPRDLPRLLDEVAQAGLWLIVQPGPWTPVDFDAGGLPGWLMQDWVGPDLTGPRPFQALREWWGRLFPLFRERANLVLTVVDGGEGTVEPLVALAEALGAAGTVVSAAQGWQRVGAAWREGPPPLPALADYAGDCGVELRSGPLPAFGGPPVARLTRELGAGHPRAWLAGALARGARVCALTPFSCGVTWGRWGTPDSPSIHGLGAPWGESLPTAAYYAARCLALTAETLGEVLAAAEATDAVYASDPHCLLAARTDGATTVAFLHCPDEGGCAVQLSLPTDEGVLATAPVALAHHEVRLLPLNWPLQGGVLRFTTLEPLLRVTIAGRQLVVLVNSGGGDVLLSDDFRPRHARGAVRTQRTPQGLAVHMEAARVVSVLLEGPAGPVQLLALEPRLAARVWPLDDAWRTTPVYPAVWSPEPESPARGVLIGPELVTPNQAGGSVYEVEGRGMGYRWGPWRGSDPHTWLSPFYWSAPPALVLPELGPWETRAAAPEIAPEYDDRSWRGIPPDAPLAMEVQGIRQGFAWYRGVFTGTPGAVTVTFRHACDLFLNGELLAVLDTSPHEPSQLTPRTLPLPPRLLRERNVLVALTESLGHAETFAAVTEAHGLLSCVLDDGAPIVWRVRGGLSSERAVQGVPGFADWTLVPELGDPHITWHRATFALRVPEVVDAPLFLGLERASAKVYIYLNGWPIGRAWEARGVQTRFWLPKGLLRYQGDNELLLAQWTRGGEPGLGRVWLESGPVYGWHEDAGHRL